MCRMPLSLCRGGIGYRGSGRGAVLATPPLLPPHMGLDSHEAERAVGDEEQLFSVGHQTAQDCKCFVPSEDVLL